MAVLTNPTDLARETLKLLATRRIAPTPENYQRYYHEIAGTPPNPEATATVVERDPEAQQAMPPPAAPAAADSTSQLKELLALTLELGMAARLKRFPELADEARGLAQSAREARGVDALTQLAARLRQFFFKIEVRGQTDAELLAALLRFLGLLVDNIAELVEDDKWLSGQVAVIREVINEPATTERIAEAERRFKEVVYKQSMLKHSLREAKHTLKDLIGLFVSRLSELSESATDYHQRVEGYAGRLQRADDIQTLKAIVDELMADTRSMQLDMTRYRDEIVEARRTAEQAEGRLRKLEAELEHISEQVSQDQLTGMLNRRGLDDAMRREMARAERRKSGLCVAVLDLDSFKKLNDRYGHQAGDNALVHLTKVARKTLRPTDTVARYGGEEFVILFSDTDLEQAVLVLRRLQRELAKRFFLHDNERLLITFSAGVAMLAPGESQAAVLARADKAMYQAKVQGRNRVVSAEQ